MRLKLRNFRCHTNSQFELPESGLVLLSGSSGSGKSTLLKAILYALFGNKAVRKPYTFGTTTCSVTLEWLGLRIHRTNRPNRVLVNEDLEDAAAQAYIDEKLGLGYEEFLISSYIPQKNNSSILSLAQTEQLSMIKTLALNGEQHELHKEKLKEMLRESSTSLTEKRTEIQFTQREFDRLNETVVSTAFPLQRAKSETKKAAIDAYHKRVQSYHKRLSALLERKAALQEKLTSYRGANAELDATNDKLSDLKTQLAQLESRQDELQVLLKDVPEDINKKMKATAVAIDYLEQQKEYDGVKKQYKQIKADEQKERQTRKTQLERKYEDPEPATEELEEIQGQLLLWEQHRVAVEALKKLQKELGRTGSKEELLEHYVQVGQGLAKEKADLYQHKEQLAIAAEKLAIEKTIVHCPKCKASLRWQDKALVTVHNHQPVEKRDYRAELAAVEIRIGRVGEAIAKNDRLLVRIRSIIISVVEGGSLERLKQRAEELTGVVTKNTQRKEELARLEREPVETPALKRMGAQVKKRSDQLAKLRKELASDLLASDISSLREKHRDLYAQVNKYQEYTQEMTRVSAIVQDLRTKFANCSSQAQLLEQQVAGVDPAALEKKITAAERDLAATKREEARDAELRERVDAYLAYHEQKRELRRWRDELAQITKQVKKAELVHTARLTLKDNYTQAEILALESTISSINEHTRYYLDTFFAEHQLAAILEAADKGRSLKINTAIQYKGNEYDTINQMSGGEFDRCTLSSICGINSMLSSPILILDECLASLDTDTNTEIIRFLSELGEDKLVLVCSHEAVRGIFDEIIELH